MRVFLIMEIQLVTMELSWKIHGILFLKFRGNPGKYHIFFQLNRISPDTEAEFYCRSGIDKDCFEVRYISDYKGIKLLILTCIHGR